MRIVEMNGWTIVTWKMIWTNKMLSYQNLLFKLSLINCSQCSVSFVIWHSSRWFMAFISSVIMVKYTQLCIKYYVRGLLYQTNNSLFWNTSDLRNKIRCPYYNELFNEDAGIFM